MNWQREGRHWPHRDASRFVDVGPMRWHVQCMGQGPVLLLLHGTGAATHSWRGLMPLLAAHFTVVAPDLPGHGFSSPLPRAQCHLPGMSDALAALLQSLGLQPAHIVGHSAGAALSAQFALAGPPGLRRLVWLNGALLPFDGWLGQIAQPMARALANRSWLPRLAAWSARDAAAVRRLIDATGSKLDAQGVALYGALMRSPPHVAGALAMMAGWDLRPLLAALPRLALPVLLVHGTADRTVPVAQSDAVARRLPDAEVQRLDGLGHLAHEQQPGLVAASILRWCGGR